MNLRGNASLILTVLNEADGIRDFLESLTSQTVLPAEIVVVDAGSSDGTADQIRGWQPPAGCQVRLIIEPGAGISKGRNTAINAASHERILVTDAGTAAEPRWAELLLREFDAEPAPDVVSGFFYPTGSTLLQRAIAFTITPDLSEIEPAGFLPSSRSVAFTRQAWRAAGGYPEWLDYCEDLVFDLALGRTGHRFRFIGDARVSWSARPNLRGFMEQYYRYARGDGKAGLWPRRHAIRYTSYATGALLLFLTPTWPWALAVFAGGVLLYLQKFWQRIASRRGEFGTGWPLGLCLVPVIVVAGDLAKMAGYPVGLWWRSRSGGRG